MCFPRQLNFAQSKRYENLSLEVHCEYINKDFKVHAINLWMFARLYIEGILTVSDFFTIPFSF